MSNDNDNVEMNEQEAGWVRAWEKNEEKKKIQRERESTDEGEFLKRRNKELAEELSRELGLAMGRNGPISNLENTFKLVTHFYNDYFSYDEFSGRFYHSKDPKPLDVLRKNPRVTNMLEGKKGIDNLTYIRIQKELQEMTELKNIGLDTVISAIDLLSKKNGFNGMRDWITKMAGLRVKSVYPSHKYLFQEYCGVEDNRYTQQASANFCLALINRVFDPGCKLDQMFILEGDQGVLKSSFWRLFGGPNGAYYSENARSLQHDKFLEELQGKAIIEFSELSTIKSSSADSAKSILSRQYDYFRAPYQKKPSEHPRSCVLVGSTNDLQYLKDPTGSRRYVCMKIRKEIDIKGLEDDLPNILNSALRAYHANEPYWEYDRDNQERENESRTMEDSNEWIVESAIKEFCSEDFISSKRSREDGIVRFTVSDIMEFAASSSSHHYRFEGKGIPTRIGLILKKMGIKKEDPKKRKPIYIIDDMGMTHKTKTAFGTKKKDEATYQNNAEDQKKRQNIDDIPF